MIACTAPRRIPRHDLRADLRTRLSLQAAPTASSPPPPGARTASLAPASRAVNSPLAPMRAHSSSARLRLALLPRDSVSCLIWRHQDQPLALQTLARPHARALFRSDRPLALLVSPSGPLPTQPLRTQACAQLRSTRPLTLRLQSCTRTFLTNYDSTSSRVSRDSVSCSILSRTLLRLLLLLLLLLLLPSHTLAVSSSHGSCAVVSRSSSRSTLFGKMQSVSTTTPSSIRRPAPTRSTSPITTSAARSARMSLPTAGLSAGSGDCLG
jgi:hypothetical protein